MNGDDWDMNGDDWDMNGNDWEMFAMISNIL
jgi:hypothetical protein